MNRLATFCSTGLALAAASPAVAHVTASPAAHWHAGDGWGLLAVAALTAVAAWIGRASR